MTASATLAFGGRHAHGATALQAKRYSSQLVPAGICRSNVFRCSQKPRSRSRLQLRSAEGDDKPTTTAAEARGDEDLPPWLRKEKLEKAADAEGGLPFGVYLLGSSLVAIAAVGSVFELLNKNPIFGVIQPDSPLYTPILGFFAITGLPTAGYLFIKGVDAANKLAERMDKIDGGGR